MKTINLVGILLALMPIAAHSEVITVQLSGTVALSDRNSRPRVVPGTFDPHNLTFVLANAPDTFAYSFSYDNTAVIDIDSDDPQHGSYDVNHSLTLTDVDFGDVWSAAGIGDLNVLNSVAGEDPDFVVLQIRELTSVAANRDFWLEENSLPIVPEIALLQWLFEDLTGSVFDSDDAPGPQLDYNTFDYQPKNNFVWLADDYAYDFVLESVITIPEPSCLLLTFFFFISAFSLRVPRSAEP